jgi:hypothetical protein
MDTDEDSATLLGFRQREPHPDGYNSPVLQTQDGAESEEEGDYEDYDVEDDEDAEPTAKELFAQFEIFQQTQKQMQKDINTMVDSSPAMITPLMKKVKHLEKKRVLPPPTTDADIRARIDTAVALAQAPLEQILDDLKIQNVISTQKITSMEAVAFTSTQLASAGHVAGTMSPLVSMTLPFSPGLARSRFPRVPASNQLMSATSGAYPPRTPVSQVGAGLAPAMLPRGKAMSYHEIPSGGIMDWLHKVEVPYGGYAKTFKYFNSSLTTDDFAAFFKFYNALITGLNVAGYHPASFLHWS